MNRRTKVIMNDLFFYLDAAKKDMSRIEETLERLEDEQIERETTEELEKIEDIKKQLEEHNGN